MPGRQVSQAGTGIPTATGAGSSHNHVFTGTAIVVSGHERVTNPPTADLVSIVAALDPPVNVAMTIVAQPVVPCKLQVRIVYAGSVTGTLTLIGIGARGQAVTQAIPLVGGTRTVTTTDAYATLTSATITSIAGAAGGDTVGIGQSSAIGLAMPRGATLAAVYKANVDDVNETVGTVDATAGTIIPTTAPNGTRDYDFWWNATVTPAGTNAAELSHTHALT